MTPRTVRFCNASLRNIASMALAGSLFWVYAGDLQAGEPSAPAHKADGRGASGAKTAEAGRGEASASRAGYAASSPGDAFEPAGSQAPGLMRVAPYEEEEIILSPPVTLDEAIRVAALEQGEAREQALAALWRRYNTTILLRSLTARIDTMSREEATLAAEILWLGGETGHRQLMQLLASADPRQADRAVYAVASLGGRGAPLLMNTLALEDHDAKRRAVWGLGQVGGPEAARAVGALSTNRDQALRMAALEALAAMTPADRAGQVADFGDDASPEIRRRVAELIAREPEEEAQPVLIRLAADRDPDVRVAAAVALASLSGEGLMELGTLLTDPLPAVRAEAARGLAARLSDSERMNLLRSPDVTVREAALEALLPRGDVAVGVFAALAEDPDPQVRQRALERIIATPSEDNASVDAALAFLTDPLEQIELNVVEYVAHSGRVIDPHQLVPLAKRGFPAVQQQAVASLLASRAPAAVAAISQFLAIHEPEMQIAIIDQLGQVPVEASVAQLAGLRRAGEPMVRRAVIGALARLPFDSAREPLEAFLDDPLPALRAETAMALGKRRDPRSVMALSAHGRDSQLEVRGAILEALDQIGDDVSAGAVAQFLHDPDHGLRRTALASLERLGTPMAMGFVGELFAHEDPSLRRDAVAVLERSTSRDPQLAATQLSHFLRDPVSDVQLVAIAAAGRTGRAEAIAGLVQLSDEREPRVRLEAVSALQHVRDNRAVAALERFVGDGNSEVRQGVYRGLARLGGSRGFSLLVDGMDDAEESVRITVAKSVAELHLGMAVPRLVARLPKAAIKEQKAIIEALGQIRNPEATAKLVDLRANGGVWEKIMAKKAMDRWDDAEAMASSTWSDNSSEARVEVSWQPRTSGR